MRDIGDSVDSTFLRCLFFTGVELFVAGIRLNPPDLLLAIILLILLDGGGREDLVLLEVENGARFFVAYDVSSGGNCICHFDFF